MEIWIVAGVLVVLVGFIWNSLIGRKNQVKNAFAGLDASLKQRYDLIPNLVSATKEYMKHEKDLLTQLTELRSRALSPNLSVAEKESINKELNAGLGRLNVSMEAYPELKSNTNVVQLQKSLHDCEENISASRRFYNAAVTSYNNAVEMFPTNVFAAILRFKSEKLFEISPQERENVSVKDLFKQN